MKFITTVDDNGTEEIFQFPNIINHDAMAEILGCIKNSTHGNWHRVYRNPISAGFVSPTGQCYGRSESLNLSSRPEDTELLKRQLG